MPADTGFKFDKKYWQKIIRRPDWYLVYEKYINQAKQALGDGHEDLHQLNKEIRHFFEEALLKDQIDLADSGPDLDRERKPVDRIVIHHTSGPPGYRLSYMNAVQLLNVYAPYFCHPTPDEAFITGKPIWSNHIRDGKPVFWVYHWLMRMDGRFERLLEDNQIGWQAGNWDINTRSVAICLDNDYEFNDPAPEVLEKLAGFIKKQYPRIKPSQIIGHCEARQGTVCPGKNFINGWKPQLLKHFK